jgi:hypothetical protein
MLIRGVIQNQLSNHPQPPFVRFPEECFEIAQGAIIRVYAGVISNIVAIIPEWRGTKGKEPQGGNAEVLQVVEFFAKPLEIAYSVTVAVKKGSDVQFVDDCVLEPQGIINQD